MTRLLCFFGWHRFQSFNPIPGPWVFGFCRRCGCVLERR